MESQGGRVRRIHAEDCNPRTSFRQNVSKSDPLRELWRKFEKKTSIQDSDAGPSQARRYCSAVELYANIHNSPVRVDDPLCEAMDPIDERNQKRVLSGLVLWAQLGRSS